MFNERSLLVLAGLAVCASMASGQAADGTSNSYERIIAASDRDDFAGLEHVADSLRALSRSHPELEPWADIARSILIRRQGQASAAFEIMDSLDLGSNAEPMLRYAASNERCRIYKALMMLDPAGREVRQCLFIARSEGMKDQEARALILSAEVLRNMGEHDKALEVLLAAERLIDLTGQDDQKCNVWLNRATILYYQDRHVEALELLKRAFELSAEFQRPQLQATLLANMASVVSQIDSLGPREAIAMYEHAVNDQRMAGNLDFVADLKVNMANMYNELEQPLQARRLIDEAMAIRRAVKDTLGMLDGYHVLASLQWASGERDSAVVTQLRAIELARKSGALEVEAEGEFKAFTYYDELGEVEEALAHLKRYELLDDSLDSAKEGELINRLEIQFETEKKEQQLKLKEAELSQAQAKEERRSLQFKGVLGLSVLLLMIAALLLRNVRHIRALRAQEHTMHAQQVDDLMKKQEIRVLDAVVQAQQEERDRIAKDLHDHLGQMLSAIKLQFSALEGRVEGMAAEHKEHYRHVFELLDKAVTEVRRISHSMVKGTLARFGLKGALEDLAATVETPGKLHVELSLFGLEERLKPEVELGIYRMVQEMVSNILKHARATEVTIQVTRQTGMLNLMVEDNGVGFDPVKATEGLGMGNLRTRATELKGALQIDSRPGQGTTISVDIPLVEDFLPGNR